LVDISIEHVASLAEQNDLPEPLLDLASLPPSFSDFSFARPNAGVQSTAPIPSYSADDPWSTATQQTPPANRPLNGLDFGSLPPPPLGDTLGITNGSSNAVAGTGLPEGWWKNLEIVTVNVKGQQGFILNRYTVYDVTSVVRCPNPGRMQYFCLIGKNTERGTYPSTVFGVCHPLGDIGTEISVPFATRTS
jgi:sorting nexin-8